MDSVSELRSIGDNKLALIEDKSCELVIAIRRSLHGEDVASLAGGLVLEAGL